LARPCVGAPPAVAAQLHSLTPRVGLEWAQEEDEYWFDQPHEDVAMGDLFCMDPLKDVDDSYMRFFTDGEQGASE
jgi:hypothetical protein